MRGPHFSLRWMFGLVSCLAVGCGLLIYATPILSRLTLTAAILILLASVLAAACQAGERRMFWSGFAAFGLAYAWVVCGSWQSPDGGNPLRERLATTAILQWCHERAPHTQSSTTTVPSPGSGMMGPMGGSMAPMMMGSGMNMPGGPGAPGMGPLALTLVNQSPDWSDFATTGHSLFALAVAMLGGVIASRCYRQAKHAAA